jgi:transposase
MITKAVAEREQAIHLLRAGKTVSEVSEQLARSESWVRKWQRRYEAAGWSGLKDRSKAPKKHGRKLGAEVRQAIRQARSELEAEAASGRGLKYIGARAIRTRLKRKKLKVLPSRSSIERVLREAEMTRPKQESGQPEINYPHLKPRDPHSLIQVDIVPRFLPGGERVACFNALDVVSRYPTGLPFAQRRSQDASDFLVHVWQEIGLPTYTQVDNEGCFSGGATHPYVLGKVVRLALTVGTELVFSPFYHPKSNGYVERFHQDYDDHVWQGTYLPDRPAVQEQGETFFALYRQREDHKALAGFSPYALHHQQPANKLPSDFTVPATKLPLRPGRVHFMRRVEADGTVKVLNVLWTVPQPKPNQGVWVTIECQLSGATLAIYDAAPDVAGRQCLAHYPFPLKEPVLAFPDPQPQSPQQPAPAAVSSPLLATQPASTEDLPPTTRSSTPETVTTADDLPSVPLTLPPDQPKSLPPTPPLPPSSAPETMPPPDHPQALPVTLLPDQSDFSPGVIPQHGVQTKGRGLLLGLLIVSTVRLTTRFINTIY